MQQLSDWTYFKIAYVLVLFGQTGKFVYATRQINVKYVPEWKFKK